MPSEKVKILHQTVIEAIVKVKTIIRMRENSEEENPTFGERFADRMFKIVSSWITISAFASIIIIWVVYNVFVAAKYMFDPFPFLLMTFMLAGIAAIQAPVIMMSQHWQNQKNNKIIAQNLKVDNEILALHQTITVLMEQQLQQVHENQLITIKLLQGLHIKADIK